jgi:hypothetical protein
MKKMLTFAVIFILAIIAVSSHSAFLFDLSLDFDLDLKSNIIKSAQNYFGTANEPLSFDLDKGLINVHFEPEQSKYVQINPIDFSVSGMRDESKIHKSGKKTLSKQQGFEIANKLFENLPISVKSELKFDSDISEVRDTYFYNWYRYKDGILILDEKYMVNVDSVNGNIIAFRLMIFEYPEDLIDITPAISQNIAKRIAELSFNGPTVENFEPYLVVYFDELLWITKIQGQFYPFFVAVNAKDGSISFTGQLRGDVPKKYNVGRNVKVIETDFIKSIYN